MKDYLQSRTVTKILIVLGVILLALLSFQGGVIVGYHQGIFLHARDVGYGRGLTDPHSILAPFLHDGEDPNPHGAIGEIVKIASSTFMVKDPMSSEEQIVVFSPTTTLRLFHEPAMPSDLKAGTQVIVIGEPADDGRIIASFIRIVSPPGAFASGSSSRMYTQASSTHY